jgi:hypothetical protein
MAEASAFDFIIVGGEWPLSPSPARVFGFSPPMLERSITNNLLGENSQPAQPAA